MLVECSVSLPSNDCRRSSSFVLDRYGVPSTTRYYDRRSTTRAKLAFIRGMKVMESC